MDKDVVAGILYAKDLIGVSEGNIEDFISKTFLTVNAEKKLDDVMSLMTKNHFHIAIVESYGHPVGIITLEDILEEIFLTEIKDESDTE